MARLRFTDLDLFALLDADTDEARTFTTYLGYWVSLAEHIQENYGDDVTAGVLADLRSRGSFVRIGNQPRPTGAIASEMRSLLLNGWTSELRLHLIEAVDTGRLWLADHGAPVDSYYATSRHASAFFVMHHGAAPTTHRSLLNAISALVTGPRQLPPPWDRIAVRYVHSRPTAASRYRLARVAILRERLIGTRVWRCCFVRRASAA